MSFILPHEENDKETCQKQCIICRRQALRLPVRKRDDVLSGHVAKKAAATYDCAGCKKLKALSYKVVSKRTNIHEYSHPLFFSRNIAT